MLEKMTNKKVFLSCCIGNMLEFYDFTLYGFFVAILSPLYFPSSNSTVSLISGFGVFALGFFARPLGALFFGHIGDIEGRKRALSITIFGIALPTMAIGLLPTYEQIGIFAPIFLILFRLIQGFCAGGEYNGSGVFIVENTHPDYRGLFGGLLTSSGSVGALLACLMGVIFTHDSFPVWFWRIPFVLGGLICFVGFYMRRQIEEINVNIQHPKRSKPFLEVLKIYPLSFLTCILIGGTATTSFYIILTFINSSLKTSGVIAASEMMSINAFIQAACVLSLPLMGIIADKIGFSKMMMIGIVCMVFFSYPLFYAFSAQNILWVIVFQFIMICVTEAFAGPSNAYMSELFPQEYRYTGVGVGYCLGIALFGGTAPYIAANLITLMESDFAPIICILYGALMGALSLILGKQAHKKVSLQMSDPLII